ncbi:MAG: ankyrin repeat domain-containing protein [Firmicutes bacterium]|nr:ankyrin repeat domain-containing protein [Bacillota bacterium]
MTIKEIKTEYRRLFRWHGHNAAENIKAQDAQNAHDFLLQSLSYIDFVLDDIDEIFDLIDAFLEMNDTAALRILLDAGFPINTVNSRFETVFTKDYTRFYEKLDFIKLAKSYGADFSLTTSRNHNLYSIALDKGFPDNKKSNSQEIFAYLLSLPEAAVQIYAPFGDDKVTAGGVDGKMLFHIAVLREKRAEAEMLLNAGFAVDTPYTYKKYSSALRRDLYITQNALHIACLRESVDMVAFLLKNGADANQPNSDGAYPLHLAAQSENRSGKVPANARAEIFNLLIQHGADIEAKYYGQTVLYCALRGRANDYYGRGFHHSSAPKLIELGANIHTTDDCGTAIIHLSAQSGDFEWFRTCVKSGADINLKNPQGETPLLIACASGKNTDKIITALIRAGADLTASNQKGETAVDLLTKKGNAAMLEILLRHMPT